jgi:hypothetical protein
MTGAVWSALREGEAAAAESLTAGGEVVQMGSKGL